MISTRGTLAVLAASAAALVARPASASLTNAYVTQTGAAAGACTTGVQSVAWFNTAANWGTGAAQIGPGTSVLLCGTLTTSLQVQGSGTSTSAIVLQWDTGASLSSCDTTGALQLSGNDYITADLGGNSAAITCPANGTALTTQVEAVGVSAQQVTQFELRNGSIGPLFVYGCCGTGGQNSTAIFVYGATNSHFHDLTLHDARFGINYEIGNGVISNDDEIDHLTLSNFADGLWYAGGDPTSVSNGARIHDNQVTMGTNWNSGASDNFHMEFTHFFLQAATTSSINDLEEYNDTIVGPFPATDTTAAIFVDGASSPVSTMDIRIFNNVIISNGGGTPGDGYIYLANAGNTVQVYNNTVDCTLAGGMSGIGSEFEGPSTYTYENNLFIGCQYPVSNESAGPTYVGNNNLFVGATSYVWQGTFLDTLGAWQTATSQDANSLVAASAGVNASEQLQAGSAAIDAGANLSGAGIADLDTDKAGKARPATAPWDIGAYQFVVAASATTAAASTSGSTTAGATTAAASTGASSTTAAATTAAASSGVATGTTAAASSGGVVSGTTAAASSSGSGTTGGSAGSIGSIGSTGSIGTTGGSVATTGTPATTGHHGGHNGASTGSGSTNTAGGTSSGAVVTASASSGSSAAASSSGAASGGSTTSQPMDGTTGNGIQIVSTGGGCGCMTSTDPAGFIALMGALSVLRRRRPRS